MVSPISSILPPALPLPPSGNMILSEVSTSGYDAQLEELRGILSDLQSSTGLLFLTDLVWNHVSTCNTAITEHPVSVTDYLLNTNLSSHLYPVIAFRHREIEEGVYTIQSSLDLPGSYRETEIPAR